VQKSKRLDGRDLLLCYGGIQQLRKSGNRSLLGFSPALKRSEKNTEKGEERKNKVKGSEKKRVRYLCYVDADSRYGVP